MSTELSLATFMESRGYARISLSRNRVGQFEVGALINGREARMILDAGASGAVMDQTSARDRSIAIENVTRSPGPGAPAQTVTRCTLEKLDVGPLAFSGVEAQIADLAALNQVLVERGHDPVDGVLGGDILHGRGAVIDFSSSTLFLKDA